MKPAAGLACAFALVTTLISPGCAGWFSKSPAGMLCVEDSRAWHRLRQAPVDAEAMLALVRSDYTGYNEHWFARDDEVAYCRLSGSCPERWRFERHGNGWELAAHESPACVADDPSIPHRVVAGR